MRWPVVLVVGASLIATVTRAQSSVDWSQAEQLTVVMVDDQFVPDRLTLRHGVPYLLRLENTGKDLHEFTAPEFFADVVSRDPGALANGGTEVVLQPGTGVDLYIMPVRAGTYRLTCADHDWDGMVGDIVVE
ncbi:MAG TPA: cupredoxin domain-containing protein [Acetobacteraceae bacterium]|nr:cupredoxin domain-containing protein [Acetobacteraceae bacterium]